MFNALELDQGCVQQLAAEHPRIGSRRDLVFTPPSVFCALRSQSRYECQRTEFFENSHPVTPVVIFLPSSSAIGPQRDPVKKGPS